VPGKAKPNTLGSLESYQLRHFRQVLGRRYEFQAFLGRGAFASVYLVQNLRLKRREALKILADTFEADSAARFVAEATMVASLDHPNIVQVYDYGEVEGVIWYSMQYIEGPMLRDEMWARRRRRSRRSSPAPPEPPGGVWLR
jgi:serine/threonine protein kinase